MRHSRSRVLPISLEHVQHTLQHPQPGVIPNLRIDVLMSVAADVNPNPNNIGAFRSRHVTVLWICLCKVRRHSPWYTVQY